VGAHTAILIPQGQVFALDIKSQANRFVANMPLIHNSWGIEKAHQLRIRDAKQIAQLSGFIEAAQREISDDPHFSKAALCAHQRLI
jgi:AraC family transcriptional activator of pobA